MPVYHILEDFGAYCEPHKVDQMNLSVEYIVLCVSDLFFTQM